VGSERDLEPFFVGSFGKIAII